jgi:hypothetical protein
MIGRFIFKWTDCIKQKKKSLKQSSHDSRSDARKVHKVARKPQQPDVQKSQKVNEIARRQHQTPSPSPSACLPRSDDGCVVQSPSKPTKACVTCGSTERRSKLCSGCRSVRYCSSECQLLAWPKHRAVCKPGHT